MIEQLKQELLKPLPGQAAQLRMAPPLREKLMEAPPDARLGGVMVLLFEKKNEWHTLLIRRTEDGNTHSGQISFPGGKKDDADADMIHTALRECEEEIGIPADAISVLGTLSSLYIPPSRFLVTPTLGFLSEIRAYRPSQYEVQEIIELPLNTLFAPEQKSNCEVRSSGDKQLRIQTPVYRLPDQNIIWGATAMILSELEHILQNIKSENYDRDNNRSQ